MPDEAQARAQIDRLLVEAGWVVCDVSQANIHATRGVAIREFALKPGYGFADYLLYLDGKAAGVIEAKKQGVTLTGVEIQSDKYTKGLPAGLPAWNSPLPFSYQSTGVETRFTNGLDPEPRSRNVFGSHKPETLAEQLDEEFAYDPSQLDRDVVAVDQIRTIIRAFRDKLFTEIFPGRTEVPKTLVFAKACPKRSRRNDSHAGDIVKMGARGVRQGQRIRAEDHLPHHRFCNSYHPPYQEACVCPFVDCARSFSSRPAHKLQDTIC